MEENQLSADANKYERLTRCPYCRSIDIIPLYTVPDWLTKKQGIFYLAKCSKCKLVFQNPRIKEELIGEYYADDLPYYQTDNRINNTKPSLFGSIRQSLEQATLINHFNYYHLGKKHWYVKILTRFWVRLKKVGLFPNFIEDGKVLEIGCGTGGRLQKLKELGWSVFGIEMSGKMTEYIRTARKIDVINDNTENVEFPNNTFDAIVMSMVLEHLYDPFEQLKRITKWLKPGGELLFSIPYFESMEFRVFTDCAHSLHLPAHQTFFNKKIICEYLNSLGYTKIEIYYQGYDRDLVAGSKNKYTKTGRYIYKLIAYNKPLRKLVLRPLIYVMGWCGQASRISVTAQKGDALASSVN